MVFVIKVKYGDVLRRFTFESKPRGEDLSYTTLESKIRRLFDLPAEKQIRVTYNDGDNDVITMADDQDLVDALVMQSLNPLRLHVTPVEPKSMPLDTTLAAAPAANSQQPGAAKEAAEVDLKQILQSFNAETLKQAYEPLLREAGASPRQLNDLVDQIVKSVTAQVQHAVKGAEAVSRSVGEVLFGQPEETMAGSAPIPGFPIGSSTEVSAASVKVESNEAAGEVKSVNRVFHNGVQCDGCGMSPISGTRFKSVKKHDYDLCSNCFKEAEDQADYTRIDRPLYRPRHFHHGTQFHPSGSGFGGRIRCPALNSGHHPERHMSMSGPYASRSGGRWCQMPPGQLPNGAVYGGKLDSRFVEDVTIMDGTEMAPGTRFTKIWRLRNSGKIPWAPQTKLIHVGGDELGSVFVVPLELPEHGLLPEKEVEAAVDLIAPEKPGRYVSHWRLASPAGPKFGHRVWVVIQVVSKENTSSIRTEPVDSDVDRVQEDELTEKSPLLAAATSHSSREAFVGASHEAFVKASHETAEHPEGKITYPEVDMTSSFVDILEPFSGLPISEREGDSEVIEDVPVAVAEVKEEIPTENVVQDEVAAIDNCDLGGGFSMVEMPTNGSSDVKSAPTTPTEEVEVTPNSEQEKEVGDEAEEEWNTPERLSVKLEAMGFSDRKLNVELLVRNELDLRRTLDDLFAAAEWDPILEELEEMGFYDTEMNRRLMFKNNGSVKRVVKELVQMCKEPADQGKAKSLIIE